MTSSLQWLRTAALLTIALLMLAACSDGKDDNNTRASEAAAEQRLVSEQSPDDEDRDPAAMVEPRIGSFPPGFTNPGAAVPHGMVTAGPDTEGPVNYGGYSFQNLLVTGFSQTHMSAGVPQGGQLPLLPIVGPVISGDLSDLGWTNPLPAYASLLDRLGEVAEPGYYKATLLRYGVTAEMTATERAAMHRYRYLSAAGAGVIFDVSRDLKGYHPAELTWSSDGVLSGRIDTSSPEHSLYFALRASRPFALERLDGSELAPSMTLTGDDVGVVLRPALNGEPLLLKIAVSYVDEAGARNNLGLEMPDWDFDALRLAAREKWNTALGKIEVQGGTGDQRSVFYSALYRAQKFPSLLSDADGRYRMEDTVRQSDTPRYTQFSLWDTYRGHSALLAEISPQVYRDMVASLVDYHDVAGTLPRWQLGPRNPAYMSGDPAVPFIGEGWCRGLLEPALRTAAYGAMRNTVALRDAEIEAGYKPTPQPAGIAELAQGGGRNAGTTLEYGIADFALALMADSRNDRQMREERLAKSLNYRNLLDPETGWMRPRDEAGEWIAPFRPEAGYGFQEGTSWQYSWLVMHDLAGLYSRMAAVESVEQRLDTFFGYPLNLVPLAWPTVQNQITAFGTLYLGNQYAPGNEHDLQAPYLYNYLGAAWKSQVAARAAASIFTTTPNGLPGNDDLGALSGWLVWTQLGLYPMNPGTPLFVIGSPQFERAVLHRPGGDVIIEAGGTALFAGYVNGADLNGQALAGPWLVMPREAAVIGMQVGQTPVTDWGVDAPPPSVSTHDLADFGCRAD